MKRKSVLCAAIALLFAVICLFSLPVVAQAETSGAFTYEVNDGVAIITGYSNTAAEAVVIPAKIKKIPVVGIADGAFADCVQITSVTIPEGVKTIGADAFRGCSNLKSVKVPTTLESVGENAFYACANIRDIYVSDVYAWWDVEFASQFSNPLNLDKSAGLRILDAKGNEVTSFVIADGVEVIPEFAFKSSNLKSITIPGSVKSIGIHAFYNCTELVDVNITDPDAWCKVDFAETHANPMYYASRLHILDAKGDVVTKLQLSANTMEIPAYRFQNAVDLKEIYIDNTLHRIGENAFVGCNALEAINVHEENPAYSSEDGVLFTKDMSKLILAPKGFAGTYSVPKEVQEIDKYAFLDCNKLVSIVLPHFVTVNTVSTGMDCVDANKYPGVRELDALAFDGCTALKYVFYLGTNVADKAAITAGCGSAFAGAEWHYGMEAAMFADKLCFHCVDCDDFYRLDGTHVYATITFKDADGSVIEEKNYYHNEIVVAPEHSKAHPNPNAFKYVLSWDKEIVACDGNAVYTAVYTEVALSYTVTFVDDEGNVLSSNHYGYGDKVVVPDATATEKPSGIYAYEFLGWDKEVTACTADVTYTATYKRTYAEYQVAFVDENGNVLDIYFYHFGEPIVRVPEAPEKPADLTYTYEFAGWDSSVTACYGDATYTATYKGTYIDYTVTFQHGDGKVIKEYTLHYGDAIEIPEDTKPANKNFSFVDWDKEVTATCEGNAVYTAVVVLNCEPGDANLDKKVDSNDVSYMLGYLLFPEAYPMEPTAADVNSDGAENGDDVAYLIGHILYKNSYPIKYEPIILAPAVKEDDK